MELNERQIEAVNCTEGPLLILAGAGSGKTTVLINRIYHLINDVGVKPYNILAITFTNKAADELKNRLEARLGEEALDIWACTFHSACVRILRQFADRVGFERNFNIYDTTDSNSLIKHIIKDMNLDEKYYQSKKILGEISHAKEQMIMPDQFEKYANISADLHKIKLAEIYTEYMRRLKNGNAMDFDDLLLYTVILLKENSDVRQYWINRFKYILIDEYQDTNKLQYMFASLLTGPDENICVVGDDDQSIYKFRGATIENILNFENQFKNCTVIRLEQNYRSTGHILEAANSVIRNNTERKGKELWTDKGLGEKIVHQIVEDQNHEADFVSSTILNAVAKGDNWRDFAVLYRSNAQSNAFEYSFKRNGIPYKVYGGTKFFDRAEVKDILSYLYVVNSPSDDIRLERIINNPPRGIGAKSLENARIIANTYNLSLYEVISHAKDYPELQKSHAKFAEFVSMIESLRLFAKENTTDNIYDEIINKTGYITYLEGKNTIEDTGRIENVKELKSSILTYIEDTEDGSLEGYLASVALYSDLDNYDSDSGFVTLMTMHSSKGLEFPYVFIVGMEETVFPGMPAIGIASEMEEERRLCYVALTRAMKKLFLTSAKQRLLYGHTNANRTSRFIDEIPEEHIELNIPKGYRHKDKSPYTQYSDSSYSSSYNNYSSSYGKTDFKSKDEYSLKPDLNKAASSTPVQTFSLGDNVMHSAFGEGVIYKMTPMGGDYLLEINFSDKGTKKLMLKAANKFLKKI